jgi:hypothetical protein
MVVVLVELETAFLVVPPWLKDHQMCLPVKISKFCVPAQEFSPRLSKNQKVIPLLAHK